MYYWKIVARYLYYHSKCAHIIWVTLETLTRPPPQTTIGEIAEVEANMANISNATTALDSLYMADTPSFM